MSAKALYRIISELPNTAAGPNGIPFAIYKRFAATIYSTSSPPHISAFIIQWMHTKSLETRQGYSRIQRKKR